MHEPGMSEILGQGTDWDIVLQDRGKEGRQDPNISYNYHLPKFEVTSWYVLHNMIRFCG